ncbi:MAG: DUF4445 domain-containing protein [Betaproteobacteria bacterium]|nr:DUF4445 domain-containing protein [Betaproteobacteria bacterium]
MSSRKPHSLSFPELEREIPSDGEETIYQSARRGGVRIVGACGGRGACGTCVVRIVEGAVALDGSHAETNADGEENGAGKSGKGKKWVRACRTHARSNCTVEVAPRSLAPVVRAEVGVGSDNAEHALPLDPAVVGLDVAVPEATLSDNLSDADRIARALPNAIEALDLHAARSLSQALRDGRWSVRACLHGSELIDVVPSGSRLLGLAVDLGTTNVAGFLVDLESGVRLASLGIENPQVAWGADLISRINHAIRVPGGAEELRAASVAALNALAHDLCQAVGAHSGQIVDVAICGNTAMHHLLLGLPVSQLGRAPFVAAVRDTLESKARELGLAVSPGAWVHAAPNVGGFVGGDHVTTLLATENHWGAVPTSLVMDIGTNTEISLMHGGARLTASCPSGPALEGGHIACGMRAAEGAIERVGLEDGRIVVGTIGGRLPVGLCGSGVLDALAVLHRAHVVDARGRMAADHPVVEESNNKRAAVLAPGVVFSQDDVRAVQLAKAAIRSGTELLLREAGLQASDIGRFVIAGAFGAYIDVRSGIEIGLFPDLPPERFAQVGNAAGAGVQMMLASKVARARVRELAEGCRYIELSTYPDFQKTFLKHIGFGRQKI